jgi:hypothetical protein
MKSGALGTLAAIAKQANTANRVIDCMNLAADV